MKTRTPLKAGDEVFVKGGTRRIAVRRLQTNGIVELAEPVENQLYWPSEMLERCDPTLGDMLAKLMEQEQSDKAQNAARNDPKQERTRQARKAFLEKAAEKIESEIKAGRIPEVAIDLRGLDDWISSCIHHQKQTVDYDLYVTFSRRLATQGITFAKTHRDGQWYISVAPIGMAA